MSYPVVGPELLTGVTSLSAEGHECVLVQLSCLVILGLYDGRASHCGLGCGNNDEVLAGDTQENLPSERGLSETNYRFEEQQQP